MLAGVIFVSVTLTGVCGCDTGGCMLLSVKSVVMITLIVVYESKISRMLVCVMFLSVNSVIVVGTFDLGLALMASDFCEITAWQHNVSHLGAEDVASF